MGVKNTFDFAGETVLITGSGGIGAAVAEGFAECGANVALVDAVEANAVSSARKVSDLGARGLPLVADLTVPADVERVVATVLKEFEKIDILVHTAARNIRKPALDLTFEEFRGVIDVNLSATFLICTSVGRHMVQRRKGSIVNVASIGAYLGSVNYSAYNASKAGVATLTKVLAHEWIKHNVRVNALAPGPTATPFTEPYWSEDPRRVEAVVAATPAGRVGLPRDHVGPVLFLCSKAADWVVGQVLSVDGGFTLG